MPTVITIARGENKRLTRNLKQANGSSLALSAVQKLTVEIVQRGRVVVTYVHGVDPEVSPTEDGNGVVLELTSALTSSLQPGQLIERYLLELGDGRFAVEPGKAKHTIELREVFLR